MALSVPERQALLKQLDGTLSEANKRLALENDQLKLQLRLQNKPQRQSLVESSNQTHTSNGYQSRNDRNRNLLQERLQTLDWQQLADREQPLPENVTVEQLLKDFGQLYLYKSGHYGEV